MAKKSNSSQKPSEEKVAEITSKGTIISALFGFLGVVIVAILGYLGSRPSDSEAILLSPTVSITNTPFIISEDFEVSSTKSWQKAINVEQGDMIRITYKSGQWTNNKNFTDSSNSPYVDSIGYTFRDPFEDFISGANLAALIGRVGTEKYFEVGLSMEFQSPISGDLEFQINDDKMSDNDGSIWIQIVVDR